MENNFALNHNEDSSIFRCLNNDRFSGKPALKAFLSIFLYFGHAIKSIVLVGVSFIYFTIATTSVILYIIFYEHLIEKIINRVKKQRRKSPYYYKWRKHHLELNWDE